MESVSNRAYFEPAVNKWPTHLKPGYFLTRPDEIFFDQERKRFLKNEIWVENFPDLEVADPRRVKKF